MRNAVILERLAEIESPVGQIGLCGYHSGKEMKLSRTSFQFIFVTELLETSISKINMTIRYGFTNSRVSPKLVLLMLIRCCL